ncbi:glycosyltransferase family protein [Arthrobacter caoxuetaonis]|uniref:Glycosyltransferase n=1 Tax=Arthrobacter caoxuetaonis TaxID=2886935 RepID=A0A9X1SBB5_9MICC|nr:glycosyltransferase [Arthrobacter caoxuetaonis]MCC3297610.1 glycosyltransferase [Arthrobacter caoxuetaonis]USQ56182.1 glycosyltransferase [Arthrobacter caoxuetaonis]
MGMNLSQLRRAAWHLRTGGYGAVAEFRRRRHPERLGLHARPRYSGGRFFGFGKQRRISFDEFDFPDGLNCRRGIKAAVILDDFSRMAFGFEWQQVELTKARWSEEITGSQPDLLFVESAWNGNGGEWQYQLTGTDGPKSEFRALVEYCRKSGIPTVFWNKEDPPHYADFLETARLFDYVFTSDTDRVSAYKSDLGHDRIGVLQFAAQPAIHNPVRPRSGGHERGIAFAGMYFAHKYPERRAQLELLLGAAATVAAQTGTSLDIFSRHSSTDENYRFPEAFRAYLAGTLSYPQMLTAYKAYRVFLNVNSVVDSPSMCARRIFEITAAGTTVISTPSRALEEMWLPSEQFVVGDQAHAEATLKAVLRNPELSDRQLHLAQRKIWGHHTYAHRVDQLARAVLPGESTADRKRPTVSLLVSTIRPHQLEHVFQTVGSMRGVESELVLLTHGFDLDPGHARTLAQKYGVGNVELLHQHVSVPLGECLNRCVEASSGDVLSKMDDDDFYGPEYLSDLLHSLSYSGADIVGKQAHYMYVARQDVSILRFADREHKFTHSVMGPTITGSRTVFEDAPFSPLQSGEDSAFLCRVGESGGKIYSSDRFNYAQYRGNTDHTWRVSDVELIASGDVKFFGAPEYQVFI